MWRRVKSANSKRCVTTEVVKFCASNWPHQWKYHHRLLCSCIVCIVPPSCCNSVYKHIWRWSKGRNRQREKNEKRWRQTSKNKCKRNKWIFGKVQKTVNNEFVDNSINAWLPFVVSCHLFVLFSLGLFLSSSSSSARSEKETTEDTKMPTCKSV